MKAIAAAAVLITCTVSALAGETREEGQRPDTEGPAVVREAQQQLAAKGHDAGPTDGRLGPRTETALRAFQSRSGLPATGRLDERTVTALGIVPYEESASTGSSTPPVPNYLR